MIKEHEWPMERSARQKGQSRPLQGPQPDLQPYAQKHQMARLRVPGPSLTRVMFKSYCQFMGL